MQSTYNSVQYDMRAEISVGVIFACTELTLDKKYRMLKPKQLMKTAVS